MSVFKITKGRDIKIKGAAEKSIESIPVPARVAISPADFRSFRPRVLVKAGDQVKVGTPILEHKDHTEIKIVSPVSGKVDAISRGDQRVLLNVVISTDGKQEALTFKSFPAEQTETLSRETIIAHMLQGGVWSFLRQRPFSRIANPNDRPKAIFVQAMNTDPLALDVDFILEGREKEFQAGLDLLRRLTDGKVHVCAAAGARSKALTASQRVELHQFVGPHPAGNVSTHIHEVDPINKGEIVWFIRAEDVLRVAVLFLKGIFSPERIVAVTGEGAQSRNYKRTVIGAPLRDLLKGETPADMRYLSGSVLSGRDVGPDGYLGHYDSQITVLPYGGKRELIGWLSPGIDKYTFSNAFISSLYSDKKDFSLDTDKHGSDRAIVLNNLYDKYVALDIMTYFLIKAIQAGEIEEAEKLGILECDEEDFALASFACPSKTDVGAIIREGLETIEREG